jgi:hypothetical protein
LITTNRGSGVIVPYIRSSSHSSHRLCEFSWWMQYNLGWKPLSNMAADRGSIVHKALESLARAKLAQQNGQSSFTDSELSPEPIPADVTDDQALEMAWGHYTTGPAKHHRWQSRDHDECRRLFEIVLTHLGGAFNPRLNNIVQPEQFFDIEVAAPWGEYDFPLPNGERLKGRLRLKGTVDLIVRTPSQRLSYVDWKTGRRWCWATNKPKTVDDLYEDPQMRLYHLALHHLYPEEDVILMTIFFVKDGGPFTLSMGKDEIPATYAFIRSWFEQIVRTEMPSRRIGPACDSFCKFGTTQWKNQQFVPAGTDPHGNHKSICDHVHDEVQQLGVQKVLAKYGNLKIVQEYGSGGGQQNREATK